ncbi:MAG: cold shock domain-containing protein [Aerococcus sp.]|nr:cold shock domain-containing protein [Aerococcus sp.]
MIKGVVKQYDPERGFGFLRFNGPSGVEEVFFHRTALEMANLHTVKAGEVVHFEIAHGEHGPQAVNLTTK